MDQSAKAFEQLRHLVVVDYHYTYYLRGERGTCFRSLLRALSALAASY